MENCYIAAEPALRIAALLGIFPMSFYGPARKKSLKIGWIDIAKSCCMVVTLVVLIVANYMNKTVLRSSSEVLFVVWKLVFSFQYFVILLLVCYQLSKLKSIVKFLRKVDESDSKVSPKPARPELSPLFVVLR